ncbi:MAG: tRNA preQ1(34) S-adenosylmethionine ribosyltransferase-isomerase QueA [PS1 clade bacterium]|nr:tRNA preQ1(34) S-adenosylmethionine ribosyltransferase-isomerase QueA [PS1 clade bacterium]
MQVDLFDFDLPEELIALRPAVPRDSARLLYVGDTGDTGDHTVSDLPEFLKEGDVLVVNTTKVIPARLTGRRVRRGVDDNTHSGAKIEVTLTERKGPLAWQCFLKPARRVNVGDKLVFGDAAITVEAEVTARDGPEAGLMFHLGPDAMEGTLARIGAMPLPPYIAGKRSPDARDVDDYQTLFAAHEGAVAAPTAGLHFTPELVARLHDRGIALVDVTLHVGPGTFLPVKVDDTRSHVMHSEWGEVSAAAAAQINAAKAGGHRVICVGTTALRLIESACSEIGRISAFRGDTDIFITPGYAFRMCDLLVTNFHLPRSTLFMLVSAFSGLSVMQNAYATAIEKKYRFYSYGDACLLTRREVSGEV